MGTLDYGPWAILGKRAVIFVTAGTQLPFDRLMRIIDELAPSLAKPIFAQTGMSEYKPVYAEWSHMLRPQEFDAKFKAASVIVAHAGIGTILTAQRLNKPIILFPREARFGEHRNDHQIATCRKLEGRKGIYLARTAAELSALLSGDDLSPAEEGDSLAGRRLFIDRIAAFLGRIQVAGQG